MVTGVQSNLSAAAGYTGGTISIVTGSTSGTVAPEEVPLRGVSSAPELGRAVRRAAAKSQTITNNLDHKAFRGCRRHQPRRFSSRQPD
jgi:hypothetical protein